MARLLVVDDEPDILDLLVRRLREDGHDVLSAAGGEAALSLVRAHGPPDAVLLEIDLPGPDGFAVLDRLRQSDPGLRAVFVTAQWAAEVTDRIHARGALHVAKPFTSAVLKAAVREVLAG